MFDKKLDAPWMALKLALGLGAFLAGLDKFFNLLADWEAYLSPLAQNVIPFSATVTMRAIGIIEMAVGIAVLTRWTREASYVAMLWLVGIALNLVSSGQFFDLAVRDAIMAVAAFTLARMTEAKQQHAAVTAIYQPSAVAAAGSR